MFPGRFPNIPDSMWNFGWNPQSMGLHGQFCGGDPIQQSQAQAQAQISALQQQNAMLNQHLHSQAQSHINHPQQLIPFHQPPQLLQPTSASFQSTPQPPVPQAPEPPAPSGTPANQPGPSTPFNPDEMLQQMKSTVESSIQAMVEKTQVQFAPPPHQTSLLPCPCTLPAIIRQPSNIHLLDKDLLDDPGLIIMVLLQGGLTNVPSPLVAAHDEDVHPDDRDDPPRTAPTPGANLDTAMILQDEIVRVLLLSSQPHLNDVMTEPQLRSIINHMTTPPLSQLFRLRRGGRTNTPPSTTTQRKILIILIRLPVPSGNRGASGRTTPNINLHGKIPSNLPSAMTLPTILPLNHLQHSPPPSQHQHVTRKPRLIIQEMTNLNFPSPSLQVICSSISGMGPKKSGSGESDFDFATQIE